MEKKNNEVEGITTYFSDAILLKLIRGVEVKQTMTFGKDIVIKAGDVFSLTFKRKGKPRKVNSIY